MKLSKTIEQVKPSVTLEISAEAAKMRAQGQVVINLSIGEPDFPTPTPIKEAAIAAIRQRSLGYVAVSGIPELKEAIQSKFKKENGLAYDTDQITVTAGAKQLIYNAMRSATNPGDAIIIPSPYWVSYPEMAKLCNLTPTLVACHSDAGYKLTPAQLEAAITPKTKLLLLNSPNNPTGAIYSREELTALGEVLLKHPHVGIITDDLYEHIQWTGTPFCNIVQACPSLDDRTIVVNGVSKAFAMTGWRLGYGAGPAHWIKAINTMTSQVTTCTCIIAQHAAIAALNDARHTIAPMVESYRRRAIFTVEAMQAMPGVTLYPTEGTFYVFADISVLLNTMGIDNDVEFCKQLLKEEKVAIVPGQAFGCPNHIRLSIAASMETLETAMKRLSHFVNQS